MEPCNREPPLSSLLECPLTRALMASDGVDARDLNDLIAEARQRIAEATDASAGQDVSSR